MTLGEANLGTTIFMTFIAIVAGYVMPTLGYLAIATDGSKVSESATTLVDQLDDRLADHEGLLIGVPGQPSRPSKRPATGSARARSRRSSTPPRPSSTAPTALRPDLSLGASPATSRPRSPPTFGYHDHELSRPYGRIGSSIPGADTVDLKPSSTAPTARPNSTPSALTWPPASRP